MMKYNFSMMIINVFSQLYGIKLINSNKYKNSS